MATGVGLRIADDECLVAIVTGASGEPGKQASEPDYIVREPVLHMSEDGDTELGGDPPAGPSHSITGFASAVGDPAGISVDEGEAYRAEDLLATALFCLIDLAAAHLSGPAEFYAVHPADWPAAQVLALRDALDYLGLRSVVLISEAILPDARTGREITAAAARSALDAVLSTPAGTTPPDPSHAENPLESTDVLPAIRTPEPVAQAYSAAIPIDRSAAAPPPPVPVPAAEPTATRVAPAVVAPPAPGTRRTPMLIAAAAAIGLLIGGIAVALLLGGTSATPTSPSLPDARSDFAPTSQPTTTTTPPPTTTTRAPITVVPHRAPIRRTLVPPPPPPVTVTTTPAPTTPTGTTTPDPSTTTTPDDPDDPWDPTPTQSPFYPYTFDPYPTLPTAPNFGFPSVGTP